MKHKSPNKEDAGKTIAGLRLLHIIAIGTNRALHRWLVEHVSCGHKYEIHGNGILMRSRREAQGKQLQCYRCSRASNAVEQATTKKPQKCAPKALRDRPKMSAIERLAYCVPWR